MNRDSFRKYPGKRFAFRLLTILVSSVCCCVPVSTQVFGNKISKTKPFRMRLVVVFPGETVEGSAESMVSFFPPNRFELGDPDDPSARIIGNRYYVRDIGGSWLRVTKETFDEMRSTPFVKLDLNPSVLSRQALRRVKRFKLHGSVLLNGHRCRIDGFTMPWTQDQVRMTINGTEWVTAKNNLLIKMEVRVYAEGSSTPMATAIMTYDYNVRVRIPIPKV